MTPLVTGNSALFLDIDGTLLDLARTPDQVVVPNDLQQALTRLHDQLQGALAFISGRSLTAIDRLFAPLHTAAIGCHGAEIRGTDGKVKTLTGPMPESVRDLFRALNKRHPGTLLEDKVYALALHYRLAPEARGPLLEALEQESSRLAIENIQLTRGKSVIEARAMGVNKGSGLAVLLAQKPFRGRRVLFGGDDVTDQDVFKLLPRIGGTGFSVSKHFPGVDHVFSSPRAVREWLGRLADMGITA
jgi:trehalose 6-phosphate phosphatase